MLVLSRKTGEQIIFARDIRVSIVTIEAGRVRLGIDAPPGVRVLRQELLQTPADQDFKPRHVTG